jgi:hypothetical protein
MDTCMLGGAGQTVSGSRLKFCGYRLSRAETGLFASRPRAVQRLAAAGGVAVSHCIRAQLFNLSCSLS